MPLERAEYGGRVGFHGVLPQPVERELVQVILQMLFADPALMGAEEPALQQRHHAVHPGQRNV